MGAQMSRRSDSEPRRSSQPAGMPNKERRLYRSGSLSSRVSGDLEMSPMDGHIGDGDGKRSRNPSGRSRSSTKSIRSRITSVAEYHGDLKMDLEQKYTRNLVFVAFLIVFGSSLQFGWGIGGLNLIGPLIKEFFVKIYTDRGYEGLVKAKNLVVANVSGNATYSTTSPGTEEVEYDYFVILLWSLTTALFIPGGMIGAFSSGYVAEKFGRKKGLLLSHIPCILGSAVSTACLSAKAPELLMLGRFISGLNCGLVTGIAPMYLAEITPYNLRGAVGTCHQLFITLGIFISSVFGLKEILGHETGWAYILLLNLVPCLVSLFILPFMPESPRYLMMVKQDYNAAKKALQFYRMQEDVSADMEEMETETQNTSSNEETFTMKQLFNTPNLRMPLFIACMLQVVQQLSGINGVFFYSQGIFKSAKVPLENIQYAVIGTNLVNVAMTVVAVPIMDRAGRRALILYPMFVMDIILIVFTTALNLQGTYTWMSYLSLICVIGYVICFAVGLGPIPMMIGAELFRQGPRPRAMSVASVVNWSCTMLIALTFELVQKAIKEFTFLIFLGLMICFTIFVYLKVPETKNKTFEEIAHQFSPGQKIEVEEVVDDAFDPDANSQLMSKISDGNHTTHPADVKVKVQDEEKQKLTDSNNVGTQEV